MTEFRISSATSTKWTNDYLAEKMGDLPISVAVTPNGHADAVTQHPDGRLYFAEPLIEKMTMKSFLGKLSEDTVPKMETVYLQSQNGNLFSNLSFEGVQDSSEFVPLRKDVPSELKWCSEALDRGIDAVNLWIGDGNSVSSIHSDPYENIYTVVRGQKHFTLLPPTDGLYLNERSFPHATYVREPAGHLVLQPSSGDVRPVRWASVSDPNLPGQISQKARPISVTVSEGQALYIPVGWYHHVEQSGITIALNWWYDTEMRGASWVFLSFLRAMNDVPSGNVEKD